MTPYEYPELDETLYRQKLPNGLTVCVVPRKGFTRSLAYFVTDYGSVHTDYRFAGKDYRSPAGVAHYLEHKMFDLPDRDVSAEFARLGASTNAFTSYDMTAYYFSCTKNFDACLRLLLEFVSTPYFTAESVEKERGIIDQEIGMNEDAPDSVIFENLVKAMYREHPIRVPILGTGETIREITPEILYDCHRAFYAPGNMLLCVIGDVDPEEVTRAAEEILGTEPAPGGEEAPAPGGDDLPPEGDDRPDGGGHAHVQPGLQVRAPGTGRRGHPGGNGGRPGGGGALRRILGAVPAAV